MHDSSRPSEQTREIEAFLDALPSIEPGAPTRCAAWTAHHLVAHVVAGGEEIGRLVSARLRGEPDTHTRSFAQRERPFIALPDAELREQLMVGGIQLLAGLDELHGRDPGATIAFTGAALTPFQLMTHIRSEMALHRWDLVGDDAVSSELLAQRELLDHGRWVLDHMPTLAEARARPDEDGDDLLALWGRAL